MKFIQSYYTDIGITRKKNQDSLALLKATTDFGDVLLTVVCDGMGGYSIGELASKYCVECFSNWFKRCFPELLYDSFSDEVIEAQLRRLVFSINKKLNEYGAAYRIQLGTTLTACLFCRERYYIAHVGDSRCYLLSGVGVRQLTRDHSFVAAEVEKGRMTPEEAKRDKRKNILYESVGAAKQVNMEFYTGALTDAQVFLLCSDGFWHCISDDELVRYMDAKVIKDSRTMRMHLNFLVEQVKMRGERDNITAVGVIPILSNGGQDVSK